MAQTTMFMSGVSTKHVVNLKRDPLLQFQVERLRPKPLSPIFYNPLPSCSASSSKTFTTVALFRSKTKAPVKKVYTPKFLLFSLFIYLFFFNFLPLELAGCVCIYCNWLMKFSFNFS